MSDLVATLPMYDWPEVQAEVDAEWTGIRDRLRVAGVDAPERLARRNADLPPVPGGIRDRAGRAIAPDPATMDPNTLDLGALWRHPGLLLAQTCWGPMELGLAEHVAVVGQPDYTALPGGDGELYSSAVLMRRGDVIASGGAESAGARPFPSAPPPIDLLRGRRFAFNEPASMSGHLALSRDLAAAGESLDLFAERVETGSHRLSMRAVAEGRADICAVDCRSWHLAQRFEPAARALTVVGWTAKRPGLPLIASRHLPPETLAALRAVLQTPSSLASRE